MKKVVFLVLFLALTYSVKAQRSCATVEVNQFNKSPEELDRQKADFESWLQQKKGALISNNALQEQSETIIYQIPVVVHIIHNGEPYGQGTNISDEQILSQIEILNRDFRHLNADSVNTPVIFQNLTADVGFEFVLALRDPLGLPTNGITRTNGGRSVWYISDNSTLKSLSYWSSDDYLNIWVAPIASFLGWAEFPTSTILDGVNDQAKNNPLTDGVVIAYDAFGSRELYPQGTYQSSFDLGRTATHEVGHFFGLRHTWGDSNDCGIDDFVADTPPASASYGYCPNLGPTSTSCGSQDMYMNYMDYVDDNCMNLFSLGQKERMVIVVNNSPRRASLLTSLALEPPPIFDVAITDIPSPLASVCDNIVLPGVTVFNNGSSDITTIDISLLVNNIETSRETFTILLNPGKDTVLYFPEITLVEFGNIELLANINSANNRQDDYAPLNNSFLKVVFNSSTVTTLDEEFTSWPSSWSVRTSAPISNWNFIQAPNLQIENTAAALKYYQVNSAFNDLLITPTLDISGYSSPYFIFSHAYGQRIGLDDELAVLVSTDCGNTFPDTLYLNAGTTLATTSIPTSFTPSGPLDWQINILDLSKYNTQNIQLAFVGKTAGGNNIYLDNFKLIDSDYEDINLQGLINESGAYISSLKSLGLVVENGGVTIIDNVEIEVTENGTLVGSQTFSTLNLQPGAKTILEFDNIFTPGYHDLKFKVTQNDNKPDNNEFLSTINLLPPAEQIPFKENFRTNTWNKDLRWTISSPFDDNKWLKWGEKEEFLGYRTNSSGNIGLHDWLISPVLDFSQTNLASMQIDLAYAGDSNDNDILRIWLSTNGGKSFDYPLDILYGNLLSSTSANEEWQPTVKEDWTTNFINLTDFAGEEEVLIGLEAIDGNGKNIYIDNFQIFITNNPTDIEIEDNTLAIYPNPVNDLNAKISFNLETKQDVTIRIIDMQGNIISKQELTGVLNQTYPLELSTQKNGIYIIQTIGVDLNRVTRILVSK